MKKEIMKEQNKKLQQFDIRVEFLVPTTITYRVTAENEQEALKEIDKYSSRKISTTQNINRRIKLKATVYRINSNMIKFSKTYRHI